LRCRGLSDLLLGEFMDYRLVAKMIIGTAMLFCGTYFMALLLGALLRTDVAAVPWLFWCLCGAVVAALVLAWLKAYLDRISLALEQIDRRVEGIEAALEKVSR